MELSFVMPCLDEARTLPACIGAARRCIDENDLDAEIIVADNGSSDESRAIATTHGARVIDVTTRGYGAALMGGIEAARGQFIIMADADESYDFGETMRLLEKLRGGADVVIGSRFRGDIRPGAMPWMHRYIGNPVLSMIGRQLFRCTVSDFEK